MDLSQLKEILQILEEKEIAEFELEEQGLKLRIRKLAAAIAVPVATVAAPAATSVPAAAGPVPVAEPRSAGGATTSNAEEGLHLIKSPIVGTFYRARDPNSPPFIEVGDRVKAGQIICIIEAMKMMNEIECEVAGEVVRVVPENGQPVQYGEPLFAIRT